MANQITDGFDWMPSGKSDSERETLFAANEMFKHAGLTANVYTGRFDFGKAFGFDGGFASGSGMTGYVLPTYETLDEGFLAFAFRKDASDTVRCGAGFFDGPNGNCQFFVSFEKYGIIRIYRGMPGDSNGPFTAIAASKTGSFEEDEWFQVEIYGLIANSGGEVEVRINTVPKLQLTGADTQATSSASYDAIFLGHWNATGNPIPIHYLFDDLYANNLSGSTNNTWMGTLRVKTQFVIANGSELDFSIGGTSPASTHWQSVLNQNLDDTKFVYSPTVGDNELFVCDPNLNSPLVRVLQVRMALRQDDATQRVARALIRIGGVNYEDDVDQYTNQTFTFYKGRWELNPDTGVEFTGAEVNGLEAGVTVQA